MPDKIKLPPLRPCPVCGGPGKVRDEDCPYCAGAGWARVFDEVAAAVNKAGYSYCAYDKSGGGHEVIIEPSTPTIEDDTLWRATGPTPTAALEAAVNKVNGG